jgi:enediyne biosynthesis protein E8
VASNAPDQESTGATGNGRAAPEERPPHDYHYRTLTLEAFADTIIPGEKRSPDDKAIAGASSGPGAVAAGAIELLETPATGIADGLDNYVTALNDHTLAYAATRGLALDPALPPFAALPFEHRTAVVSTLCGPGHPEKELWILLALFSNMAFDIAAHMHTADAIAAGHPFFTSMGFALPNADGLWRFGDFSYGRPLASTHPATTPTGSPA